MKKLFEKLFKTQKNKENNLLVQQRCKYDCGVACIAMYGNYTYDEIKEKYFRNHDFNKVNMKNVEFEAVLYDLGIELKEYKKFDPEKDGIIIVSSLNYKGKLHSVYWNAMLKRVFDSQKGLKDRYGHNLQYYTTENFLKGFKYACFQ